MNPAGQNMQTATMEQSKQVDGTLTSSYGESTPIMWPAQPFHYSRGAPVAQVVQVPRRRGEEKGVIVMLAACLRRVLFLRDR